MNLNATQPLTQSMRPDGVPLTISEYQRVGGYRALRSAVLMAPRDIVDKIGRSNLRGRGGAGFPTGLKWSLVPAGEGAPRPKYLIANADEMEPGTFKDRMLMERSPHQLIEGIVVASRAIEANVAYIFLRAEYVTAAERLTKAISEAYEVRYLGNQIAGSDFSLELYLHISAGRYLCGDETALLSALEGRRANPRTKPPHPPLSGLFGKPTVIQNVETLCNIPHILNNGEQWFRSLSHTADGGTKLYGVSGKVKRPGLWELPMGTTAREILEQHAGGLRDGLRLRGFLPGGASTHFLTTQHLDVPLDFTEVPKAGSRLGTANMIVLDNETCPVGMTRNLEHFFAQESCGWCTPCWSGLSWIDRILTRMEEGKGEMQDLDILEYQTHFMSPGMTFCALAPGAAEPLESALKYFREDFEQHIRDNRCRWKK
jgi:NADH-quinone oxidoreductase subunit F